MLAAAFVKGAIGFGFPALATPLLALFLDVKTAVPVLVLPNIVMDGVQAARRGSLVATARRMTVLLLFGALGTVLGTRLLIALPARTVTLVLGVFIVVFVGLNVARVAPRIPPGGERWCAPLAGLLAGVSGGLTNVPGTPLVLYFYALGMDKAEFVRSVAVTFLLYKLMQLGALVWFGLFDWPLFLASAGLTVVALGGFALGLRVQDRLEQATFNRLVLAFLGALGLWLVVRALR